MGMVLVCRALAMADRRVSSVQPGPTPARQRSDHQHCTTKSESNRKHYFSVNGRAGSVIYKVSATQISVLNGSNSTCTTPPQGYLKPDPSLIVPRKTQPGSGSGLNRHCFWNTNKQEPSNFATSSHYAAVSPMDKGRSQGTNSCCWRKSGLKSSSTAPLDHRWNQPRAKGRLITL